MRFAQRGTERPAATTMTSGDGGNSGIVGSGEPRQQTDAGEQLDSPSPQPALELPPHDAPPLPVAQVAASAGGMEDVRTRAAKKQMENNLREMGDAPSEEPPPPPAAQIDEFDEEMGGGIKKIKQAIQGSENMDQSETPPDSSAGESGGGDRPLPSPEDFRQPQIPPATETGSEVIQQPMSTASAEARNRNQSSAGQGQIVPANRPPPPPSTSADDAATTVPSVCEVEAMLVDAEVYHATRLSEGYLDRGEGTTTPPPSQQQHRVKYMVVALILIVGAMGGIIGTLLVNQSRDKDVTDTPTQKNGEVVVDAPARGGDEVDIDTPANAPASVGVQGMDTTAPSSSVGPSPMPMESSMLTRYYFPSYAPSVHSSDIPSVLPTAGFCFQDKSALQGAVNDYILQGCVYDRGCAVGKIAGWPMNSWCVSQVTDMSYLFKDMETFNDDISSWDTSNVRTMSEMFYGARAFNGDLSSWNVSSVTSMDQVFRDASAFNANLSSWDVSKVTTMQQMFAGSHIFNGDVSPWDVSRVTHMGEMFHTTAFNGDLSSWDVSSVKIMFYMFYFAKSFDQDLSAWSMSNVNRIEGMFWAAANFKGDLSRWDTSAVTNMYGVFRFARAFNSDVSRWNITSVGTMALMFDTATSFNQNLCAWVDRFPYDDADDIFLNSGCTFKDSPERSKGGPFCASLC